MKAIDQKFIRKIKLKDKSGRVVGEKEVVIYPGLLSMAHDEGLKSIRTSLLQIPTPEIRTAIAKAIVETGKGVFEGIGDAAPESVTSYVIPHLIRVAETRAKARALRDAVNVGVISFEELDGEDLQGSSSSDLGSGAPAKAEHRAPARRTAESPPASPPARAENGNGDQPMTEAQRRYLFRILAGKGLKREAAEERLKDLFEVGALAEVTKAAAGKMIDELLQSAAPAAGGGGNGAARHQP